MSNAPTKRVTVYGAANTYEIFIASFLSHLQVLSFKVLQLKGADLSSKSLFGLSIKVLRKIVIYTTMRSNLLSILWLVALCTLSTTSLNVASSSLVHSFFVEENSFRSIIAILPNGESLHVLQSIRILNFAVGSIWFKPAWAHDGQRSIWLRSVDPINMNLLLDIMIAKYASRSSDEVAGYGIIGSKTSPSLVKLEIRVTVKQ